MLKLGMQCFQGSSLTSISIASNIETIGDYAFRNSSLTTITFETGSSLEEIPAYCLFGTSDLTDIIIPSTVTTIGDYAFRNSSLTNDYI